MARGRSRFIHEAQRKDQSGPQRETVHEATQGGMPHPCCEDMLPYGRLGL